MTDARSFVDTNVFVYSYSLDPEELGKRTTARALLARLTAADELVLSTQVLQELFVTLTRKFVAKPGPVDARAIVWSLTELPVVQVDVPIILAATVRVRTASIAFWDALIVESALVAGATRLLTEDLQHGQVFDGRLRVENPFLPPSGPRSV